MKFIALTPTKGGIHEVKSVYQNVEMIHSLDSDITDRMREKLSVDEATKTMIEFTSPEGSHMAVAETVEEILQAIREAEDS